MERIIKRGDVFYAELNPVVGSEQGGTRPVLIISNNTGNRHSPTVIIAAITSRVHTNEYSCAGVPLFRRNGYRQSGARKPLFQNRDTAPNCLLPASLLA